MTDNPVNSTESPQIHYCFNLWGTILVSRRNAIVHDREQMEKIIAKK